MSNIYIHVFASLNSLKMVKTYMKKVFLLISIVIVMNFS